MESLKRFKISKIFFILLVSFALVGFNPIGKIRFIELGNDVAVHTNIANEINEKLKGVSVSVYFPELGLFFKTNNFDMGKGEKQARFVFLDGIKKGTYLVRIAASNDNFRDIRYRYITIE